MNKSSNSCRAVSLRIRVCMAERGIRSVAALNRKLKEVGIDISTQQLRRVVDNQTEHLSFPLLAGLISVFDCGLEALFVVPPGDQAVAPA